jgi:protein SCO1/2
MIHLRQSLSARSAPLGLLALIVLSSVLLGRAQEAQAEPSSCAHHEPLAAATPLPGTSLYHLDAQLTDQHGRTRSLSTFRGQPLLVSMFYASCTSVCPMLIAQLKRVEQALTPALRAKTNVLLVSLDPERDTERLLELARAHGVDGSRWHFTRTSESSVRELAALLGTRYRRMEGGEISHSSLIAVLDRNGTLAFRAEGSIADPAPLARAVTEAAASKAAP